MTSPRSAIYARVSTDQQDTAVQLPSLERLCAARDWPAPAIHTEVESGARARPVLDDLCTRAVRGEYRVIVVWALDRLGRSMFEVIDRVRALDAAGVRLVSYQEPWLDTGGPARDLLLSIFAWVADQERQRLIERTLAGMARARARGRLPGRPPKADGELVRRLRADGGSWRAIARVLGCSTGAVRRAAERAARAEKGTAAEALQEPEIGGAK